MESMESPLDVLSRAATMVQDTFPITDDTHKQTSTKQLPTTKWKRDRRRLPEYSRKLDLKLSDNISLEPEIHSSPVIDRTEFPQDEYSSDKPTPDAPIDMSVRHRGLPPSYSQAINSPGYRTGYRPSVITQTPTTPPPGNRTDLPSGISMCDPIIDEHFRRSLGKDYLMLFNNNKDSGSTPPTSVKSKAPSSPTTNAVPKCSDTDSAGLTVDDHFAKALGDTWVKLNQKEPEIKSSTEKTTIVSL